MTALTLLARLIAARFQFAAYRFAADIAIGICIGAILKSVLL